MNKHTPGPWSVIPHSKKSNNKKFVLAEVGSYSIVSSTTDYGYGSSVDAQLMASSPDLLDALYTLLESINEYLPNSNYKSLYPALNKAIVAISKATGG